MRREIRTYPVTTEQINEELVYIIAYLLSHGVLECDVLFGFAWGIDYYESPEWKEERIALDQILEKVGQAAASGWGGLGRNDLFVDLPGRDVQFHFCHESDIHITFNESNEVTRTFFDRWKALGYAPQEFVREGTDG